MQPETALVITGSCSDPPLGRRMGEWYCKSTWSTAVFKLELHKEISLITCHVLKAASDARAGLLYGPRRSFIVLKPLFPHVFLEEVTLGGMSVS